MIKKINTVLLTIMLLLACVFMAQCVWSKATGQTVQATAQAAETGKGNMVYLCSHDQNEYCFVYDSNDGAILDVDSFPGHLSMWGKNGSSHFESGYIPHR